MFLKNFLISNLQDVAVTYLGQQGKGSGIFRWVA